MSIGGPHEVLPSHEVCIMSIGGPHEVLPSHGSQLCKVDLARISTRIRTLSRSKAASKIAGTQAPSMSAIVLSTASA